jgi:hypothetical protein
MTEIHLTYYTDGFPVSGKSAARYINNEWVITLNLTLNL